MPMKLNVGVSRKVGLPDYGSVGASLQPQMELDAGSARTRPRRLPRPDSRRLCRGPPGRPRRAGEAPGSGQQPCRRVGPAPVQAQTAASSTKWS